jgi:hypothetical protein
MSCRATVAQRNRDIMEKNLTQGIGGFSRKWLVMSNKKMNCCANVTQRKRLRLQGDHLESHTSPHKDASERTQDELGRRRMTQEFVMKNLSIISVLF